MTLTDALQRLHAAGRIASPDQSDWAHLTRWPGYIVSRFGEAVSLPRVVSRKHTGWYSVSGRVLKFQPHRRGGYLMVALTIGNKTVKRAIHRLVLEAFVGLRPEGMETRHLNGIPTDNRLENLSYGTPAENAADRIKHGKLRHGTRNPSSKLSDEEVEEIRRLSALGARRKDVAAEFGISPGYVRRLVRGEVRNGGEL